MPIQRIKILNYLRWFSWGGSVQLFKSWHTSNIHAGFEKSPLSPLVPPSTPFGVSLPIKLFKIKIHREIWKHLKKGSAAFLVQLFFLRTSCFQWNPFFANFWNLPRPPPFHVSGKNFNKNCRQSDKSRPTWRLCHPQLSSSCSAQAQAFKLEHSRLSSSQAYINH